MSSKPENAVADYLAENEETSFYIAIRPTGVLERIQATLFDWGRIHWVLTDQRLIEHKRTAGGFEYQDIPLEKIASVEYSRRLNVPVIILGVALALVGLATSEILILLGFVSIGFGFFWRRSTLTVHGPTDGATLAIRISRGRRIQEFLWYVNAERQKREAKRVPG